MFDLTHDGDTLKATGELTIYHAAEAKAAFQAALAAPDGLQLDLSGVAELDTAGIQVLLWAKREAQARGAQLPFLHHSPVVLEVIDQLSLAGAFGDTLVLSPQA